MFNVFHVGGIQFRGNCPLRTNGDELDFSFLAKKFGLLGQSVHYLQHEMMMITDLASSYLRQYKSSPDGKVKCSRKPRSTKSLGYLYSFDSTAMNAGQSRTDWHERLQSVVSGLRKVILPLGCSVVDEIGLRTEGFEVVSAAQALLVDIIKGCKGKGATLLAYVIDKLPLNSLQWILLVILFDSGEDVSEVSEDFIKRDHLSSKYPFLIVDRGEDEVVGYSLTAKSKDATLTLFIKWLSTVYDDIQNDRNDLIKRGREKQLKQQKSDYVSMCAGAKLVVEVSAFVFYTRK
jgi:hypothetical protein